jgi:hypothetical protein
MKLKSLCLCSVLSVLVGAWACTKTSPARPSDIEGTGTADSVTDATTGITLTTPTPVTPTDNQQFKFTDQQLTLVVKNAVTTGTTALTYGFEVATDAGFAAKVYSKDGVAEGPGLTALKIDRLAGAKTYYWRAKATSGSLAGPYTSPRSFAVGPEVVIQVPVLGDPPSNTSVDQQPTLNVNTVQRTGPTGPIFYRFEVAEASSFSSLAYTATVAERTDLPYTPHKVTTKLVAEKTYFWRVQASDPASGATSPYSSVAQFKATSGGDQIDPASITWVPMTENISGWAVTSQITDWSFDGASTVCIYHTKLGLWPLVSIDENPPNLEAQIGVVAKIGGKWYGGYYDWMRPGSACKNEAPSNWGVDQIRDSPLDASWPGPRSGEEVGLYMSAPASNRIPVRSVSERTNIILVRWP